MKFTLSWLKKHLKTKASLNEILEKLTDIGLEVEDVKNPGEALKGFVIADVQKVERHPNADKLNVCTVNTGSEIFQVVCGAPNAKQGMKGVFAREGMYVPGADFTLKKTKIRDVESCGMLCSERELLLSEEHDGIIELPKDAPVGQEYTEYANLNDPIIEIALTPDRGDCASVMGIARDLSATGIGEFISPIHPDIKGEFDSNIHVEISKEATNRCYQFASFLIKDVKNSESPAWLKKRLEDIGLRPISTLVDITNFFTFDLGRPLHVFDADKLNGNLVLRNAKPGEKIKALDDKDYTMTGGELVISDDHTLHGIAGIIGGFDSGCTLETRNVYLECALFNPSEVASTGRKFSLESDARYRFERGVDPESVKWGVKYGAKMIMDLCGGTPSHMMITGEGHPNHQQEINYPPSLLKKLVGLDVAENKQEEILNKLGFVVDTSKENWLIKTPTWRYDVEGKADITEEVARIYGYNHIPTNSFFKENAVTEPALNANQRRRQRIHRFLAARGLNETVTWSFMSSDKAAYFTDKIDDSLKLINPISADLDVMRPSIFPHLLQAVQKNYDRAYRDFGIFEIGPIFSANEAFSQTMCVTAIRSGNMTQRNLHEPQREVDLYDAKSDFFTSIKECGFDPNSLQLKTDNLPSYFHPGRAAAAYLGRNLIGYFGEIHPFILEKFNLKTKIVGFECYVDRLPTPKSKTTRPALKINPLQAVERDFAFILDKSIEADKLIHAVQKADKKYLQSVQLFDIYEGTGLADHQKSIALTVTLQPEQKSFTDQELEDISQKIIASVEDSTGGKLRG